MTDLKIAIIEPVGGHGGLNYYDLALASAIYNNGSKKVILYTSSETEIDKVYPFKINKTFKGIWGDAYKFLRAIKYFNGLLKSLLDAKRNSINIVHFHYFHYGIKERLNNIFAKLFRFKIVITAHDVESFHGKRDKKKAKSILMMADAVIAHNIVSKNALIKKVNLPKFLVNVIQHGNHINSIKYLPKKTDARKEFGLNKEKVILFFGQIKKVKGLDCLLKALPDIKKDHPSVKLIIAGKVWKDDWEFYEKIITENNLESSVIRHIHYIPDIDLPNYYCAADIVALPYREIYQSGVLLMAMSYKIPVVASDILGMTEVVKHNENGFIFRRNDSFDLAKKINNALSDPINLTNVSKNGFLHMQKMYNWDEVGRKTNKVYKKIL